RGHADLPRAHRGPGGRGAREEALLRSAGARALADLEAAERAAVAEVQAPGASDEQALDAAYQAALAFLQEEEPTSIRPVEAWPDPGDDKTERRSFGRADARPAEWPALFPAATTLTAEAAVLDPEDPTETGMQRPAELVLAADVEATQALPRPGAEDEMTMVDESWTAEYTVTPALEGPTRTERLRRVPLPRGPVVALPDDDPEHAEEEPSLDAETLRKLRERFGGEDEDMPTYHGPIEVLEDAGLSARVSAGLRRLAGWFGRKG
ncbi:MAG TPA: hypothetical protein PKA64_24455, partial [Myxococcota bacterium]|nr:hypothetical protein [Myxococcota bacterium]